MTKPAKSRQTEEAFSAFAQEALRVLLRSTRGSVGMPEAKFQPNEGYVIEIMAAVSSVDPRRASQVIKNMVTAGVTRDEIADLYVPTVSKRLGRCWETDELGFAEVSIGTARLQGMLHRLGPEWAIGADHSNFDGPKVIVCSPVGVQHTLGATVIAGQLRRRGVSTRVILDATYEELKERLLKDDYNALMISASLRESLESLHVLIKKLKAVRANLPIVVGGNVLDQMKDIGALTGADCATNNLEEAIQFCGLKTQDTRKVHRTSLF